MTAVATIASKVPSLSPSDTVSTVIRIMAKTRFQQLPVVRKGELVGIVSARDVLQSVGRNQTNKTAGDIMTRNIHTIDADEHTSMVAARLVEEAIGCLPVLRKGKLVGLLTSADLLAHLAREQGGTKAPAARKPRTASRAKTAAPKRRR
ncbi:MAG: CBS domain-containing protein [Myxococcota bacterium]|nr:CBS domain-containing protein [Myxococcota bacterium]